MELKEVWKDRKLKGVLVKVVDNPAMAVIAQQCGMDFVFYDCEHGVLSYEKLHASDGNGKRKRISFCCACAAAG